jgi:hypothetical protein
MLKIGRRACAAVLFVTSGLALISTQAQAQLGRLIVTMTSPASGSTVSSTVPVSASVTIVGLLTVRGVQFRLDGSNLGAEDTSPPYSVSWDTTTASNGSHTLTAVARDALGLQFTSNSVTVTVSNAPPPDTTPPTVGITSPASGSTVSGATTVTANASDNVGVAGVQFQLDGVNGGAEATTAPYSVPWDTTTASNGSHTLTAIARDAAGNRSTSAPVTVTVSNAPPSDTTPPTVGITSPASGATVSATITVTANASDNVGVVGVQFQVDGVNGGAEATTAPYSVPWDTTTASNGSHTLTAIARDAAGNRSTSAPVTVTVANATPPPPPGSVKRFEETDPSVTYTAGWAPDPHPSLSGGAAQVSDTAGAQATFTFIGPSVSWIGGRSFQTGIARISVDGTFVSEVDTYSKTVEVQVPMFTAVGLTNTSHTLTIEATGRKNAAASLAFIIVDAFDVPAAAISRLQETDPSVTYSGDWVQGDASRQWSAGFAALSKTPGAQATFTFTGTGIRWLGFRGPQTGIARVSLDGVVTSVDTYSAAEQIQAELFKATGLADASHTLTIEVTGQQNAASTSPLIVMDAFEVTTSGARHQDTDPAIAYGPNWIQGNRDKAYSEGATAETFTAGAQATFTFTGTGVRWIGFSGPQTGIADVMLDGAFVKEVDMYAPTEGPQHTVFTATDLAPGTHTLTITVTGLKNPASSWFWVLIDAFDVIP